MHDRANHIVEAGYDEGDEELASDAEDTYHMFVVRNKLCKPIIRTIIINGVPTPMELDTGAAYSVMTQITSQRIAQLKGVCDLEPSDLKLKSYSGEQIKVLGQLPVVVIYGEKQYQLCVLVVDGEGPDLLGRDWMAALKVTFSMGDVYTVEQERSSWTRNVCALLHNTHFRVCSHCYEQKDLRAMRSYRGCLVTTAMVEMWKQNLYLGIYSRL